MVSLSNQRRALRQAQGERYYCKLFSLTILFFYIRINDSNKPAFADFYYAAVF